MRYLLRCLVPLVFTLGLAVSSFAEIVVFDSITTVKTPVMLKALTKGRFFPKGGELVEFRAGSKVLGKRLSGGDGYALFEYRPSRAGLIRIEVKTADDTGHAYLLVLRKQEKVLLVEVEGGIMSVFVRGEPMQGSKETLSQLAKKYRIVYITTILGQEMAKQWLKEKAFPESVVLRWYGEGFFEDLKNMHVNIYAVVGSPELIDFAEDYVKRRFCFFDTENAEVLEDWAELQERLLKGKGKR